MEFVAAWVVFWIGVAATLVLVYNGDKPDKAPATPRRAEVSDDLVVVRGRNG